MTPRITVQRLEIAAVCVAVLAVLFAVMNRFGEAMSEERPTYSVVVLSPSQDHSLVLPVSDPTD